jgi:flavin reductase (DIM6/NTAB) family NADH-FMN oxidoreductase RutF
MTAETPYQASSSASEAFFESFRRYGSGISIITLKKPSGEPTGFTATSLASLSAFPPRATFNMSIMASSYPAISSSEYLLVHTLGEHHRDLAVQFSGEASQRFSAVTLEEGPYGLPLLAGATSYMVGRIVARNVVGESASIVIEIVDGGLGTPSDALVYQAQDYRVARELSVE